MKINKTIKDADLKMQIGADILQEDLEVKNKMFLLKKMHFLLKNDLSSNDDKRIEFIDSIETYAYGKNKDLVYMKKEIKCNNRIKQYKNV